MVATHQGREIKKDPLTIIQYLARRAENGKKGVTTKDMMDETDLSRGSVHNYLNNTIEPSGLAKIVAKRPTRGAAEPANIWQITPEGYEWVTDLDTDELSPTVLSGEAVETARDARDIASQVQSSADRVRKTIDEIENRVDSLEDNTAKANQVDKEIDDLKNGVRSLNSTLNDVERIDQRIARDLRDLHEQVNQMDGYVYDLGKTFYGDPEKVDDDGFQGRITNVESRASDVENEVSDMKRKMKKWRQRTFYVALIAVLAFVAAASALII